MARKLFYAAVCTLVFTFAAFAQETTAGMQGVVKDASGAVVSKATVEVSSNTLIGAKSLTTDSSGYYHFTNLPPGQYTLSVSAPGFRHYQQTNILLETGHLPTVDVTLAVGGATETVEVSSEAELIDLTQSKVQTNITTDILTNVPKGLSYQSVIQFAPGARTEPLDSNNTTGAGIGHNDNGFQISGATNSENS
jgi:carboxypeptidase family protein